MSLDSSFSRTACDLGKAKKIVIDKDNIVRYIEIVPEVTNHPDYDKALTAVRSLSS